MTMSKNINIDLLAKELDARAFTELLDANDIHWMWEDADDISNPNEGIFHISVGDKYMLFIDGKLDTVGDESVAPLYE
jgi:hypothetical protein